jgi:hypothetical protein
MGRALRFLALLAFSFLSACAPEGPSAFVTFNVPPDSSCTVSPDAMGGVFLPNGLYDISPGGNGLGDTCESPYYVNLLVNSYLRSNRDEDLGRAEPNILQIHSAEVRLMDVAKRTILFDRVSPALPNPFLVTTNNSLAPSQGDSPSTGIASVEAIPLPYAEQLDSFTGSQILAEIQIFGTTTGDVDVDFKPFIYPIEICDGCLTTCLQDVLDVGLTIEEVVGDGCPDNAGADGRTCIDPEC